MFIAVVAAFLAFAPAAAVAAPPGTVEAPADGAALAEALRFLEQEGFEEEVIRSSENTLNLMLAAFTSQIQKNAEEPVPEDLLETLRQTMRDHSSATIRANLPAIKQQAAAIYAQEFTREELVRLRELSKDPVMVKARERGKVMGPKLMALGAYMMKQSEPELETKIQRVINDYVAKKSKADHSS
jgi:hypothetical protein